MAETVAANVAVARARVPVAELRSALTRYTLVQTADGFHVAENAGDAPPGFAEAGFVLGGDGMWHVETPTAPGEAMVLRSGPAGLFIIVGA